MGRSLRTLIVALLALVTWLMPTPGWGLAVAPQDTPPKIEQHVYDPNKRLGEHKDEVEKKLKAVADKGVAVYVALPDSTGEETAAQWNTRTLQASNAPAESYMIMLLPQQQQTSYLATPGPKASLNRQEVSDIARQTLVPALNSGDIPGAIAAFADEVANRTPSLSPWTIAWLVAFIVLLILLVASLIVYRRMRRSRGALAPAASARPRDQHSPQTTIKEKRDNNMFFGKKKSRPAKQAQVSQQRGAGALPEAERASSRLWAPGPEQDSDSRWEGRGSQTWQEDQWVDEDATGYGADERYMGLAEQGVNAPAAPAPSAQPTRPAPALPQRPQLPAASGRDQRQALAVPQAGQPEALPPLPAPRTAPRQGQPQQRGTADPQAAVAALAAAGITDPGLLAVLQDAVARYTSPGGIPQQRNAVAGGRMIELDEAPASPEPNPQPRLSEMDIDPQMLRRFERQAEGRAPQPVRGEEAPAAGQQTPRAAARAQLDPLGREQAREQARRRAHQRARGQARAQGGAEDPRARAQADAQARERAREQARKEAEAQARKRAEEELRRHREAQLAKQRQREAEEARRRAEEKARREAEMRERAQAEAQARERAEEAARQAAAQQRAAREEAQRRAEAARAAQQAYQRQSQQQETAAATAQLSPAPSRPRDRHDSRPAQGASTPARQSVPQQFTSQLRTADNLCRASEGTLEVLKRQFGKEATQPFALALGRARTAVQEGFNEFASAQLDNRPLDHQHFGQMLGSAIAKLREENRKFAAWRHEQTRVEDIRSDLDQVTDEAQSGLALVHEVVASLAPRQPQHSQLLQLDARHAQALVVQARDGFASALQLAASDGAQQAALLTHQAERDLLDAALVARRIEDWDAYLHAQKRREACDADDLAALLEATTDAVVCYMAAVDDLIATHRRRVSLAARTMLALANRSLNRSDGCAPSEAERALHYVEQAEQQAMQAGTLALNDANAKSE